MGKKVKFTTTLDNDLIFQIKVKALSKGKDVNEVLEELLKEWLKK